VVGDESWRGSVKTPAFVVVKTFQEVIDAMKCKEQIHVLEFKGHGSDYAIDILSPGSVLIRSGNATGISILNAAWIGEELKKSGRLAHDAIIILNGCNTGLSAKGDKKQNRSWPQLLADSSERPVYATGGYAGGTVIGMDAYVKADLSDYPPDPLPWLNPTNTTYESRAGIYYRFTPWSS